MLIDECRDKGNLTPNYTVYTYIIVLAAIFVNGELARNAAGAYLHNYIMNYLRKYSISIF